MFSVVRVNASWKCGQGPATALRFSFVAGEWGNRENPTPLHRWNFNGRSVRGPKGSRVNRGRKRGCGCLGWRGEAEDEAKLNAKGNAHLYPVCAGNSWAISGTKATWLIPMKWLGVSRRMLVGFNFEFVDYLLNIGDMLGQALGFLLLTVSLY
jgi:hypothetical protein